MAPERAETRPPAGVSQAAAVVPVRGPAASLGEARARPPSKGGGEFFVVSRPHGASIVDDDRDAVLA